MTGVLREGDLGTQTFMGRQLCDRRDEAMAKEAPEAGGTKRDRSSIPPSTRRGGVALVLLTSALQGLMGQISVINTQPRFCQGAQDTHASYVPKNPPTPVGDIVYTEVLGFFPPRPLPMGRTTVGPSPVDTMSHIPRF